jgi:hypothetical protein
MIQADSESSQPHAQQEQVNQIEFEFVEQQQRQNHPAQGDGIEPSECHDS